jgi:uncharacterized protein (TIGR02246 family)
METMMNAQDADAIRQVATRYEEAWNRHDMQALSRLFTEDADFVNVGGRHWKGRAEIERQHAERHLTHFKGSRYTTIAIGVRFLTPEIAVVHVHWGMSGDRDPNGTPRQSGLGGFTRTGIFMWVIVKQEGAWLISAAQNTNVTVQALSASHTATASPSRAEHTP